MSFINSGNISVLDLNISVFFLKLGFIPCKAEQPLQGMELQEKETQNDRKSV